MNTLRFVIIYNILKKSQTSSPLNLYRFLVSQIYEYSSVTLCLTVLFNYVHTNKLKGQVDWIMNTMYLELILIFDNWVQQCTLSISQVISHPCNFYIKKKKWWYVFYCRDDQILFNGLLFCLGRMVVEKGEYLPLWRTDGVVMAALLHAGPVEFLYYWFHRALHHHFLYSRYHSHHHSSIATEPITCKLYFSLFLISKRRSTNFS